MTIEDPSLSAHGYQLLPLATSYLVGNLFNIVGGGELTSIEDPFRLHCCP